MSASFNRRSFIGTGVAGALALNTGVPLIAQGEEKAKNRPSGKIGLVLYTIRDFLKTPDDFARSLEKVKKIGYDCVELAGSNAVAPPQLAKLLKDNGLQAVSAHTGWEAVEQNLPKLIEDSKTIGNNHMIVSSMPVPFQNEEGFKTFAKKMSEAGAKFAEAGIAFGYHNHNFEFVRYSGRTGEEILMTESDPKLVAFEIDTYWVQYGGADPAAWIERAAGRIPIVHVKDIVTVGREPVFAEVGEGNLNWPAILQAGQRAGAKYYFVEQDTCQRDPFESITLSIKNMKSWGLS